MESSVRTFIAVIIPDHIRQAIADFQGRLKSVGGDIRWVRPGSMHITLKFLGDVRESMINPVGDAVEKAIRGQAGFDITVSGTGCFPNIRRPKVLWVGIGEGANVLTGIVEGIESALEGLGFAREKRPYSAHLTLGRVRSPQGVEKTVAAMQQNIFSAGSYPADRVCVMKSELKPSGSVYSVLRSIQLKG